MSELEPSNSTYQHGLLWRFGTYIPIISSILAVCDSKHNCNTAPLDPTKTILGNRYFRSTTKKLLVHYRV